MLPLLGNDNAEIASMVANPLTTGMTLHYLYIYWYPTVFDDKITGAPSFTKTTSLPTNILM